MPSDLPATRGPRPVEMTVSFHNTVSNSSTNDTPFHADIHTRLHILMSMNEDPVASQHRSRRIGGSHLFVRKLNAGLKEYCNAR